ncbi:hypothetical protein [Sediminitomix flava]|uniref:Uncharacterized protein n=1 Tax=Sediminitomix flava TaxID=379075 RepID=A0A315Z835_SEDFL|nr:hypothetical protein [Sediminitomix flava]PWJ40211.1 hypothetical protein BC781_105279 [Sediminitomix flava]
MILKKIKSTLALALTCLLFSSSCSSFFDGVNIIVTLKEEVQPIATLQIMDAVTGEVPNNLTLTLSGADKSSIVNFNGGKNFNVNEQGIITFAIQHSSENVERVDFDVTVNANGYVSSSLHISFYGEEINSYVLGLVHPDNTPEGVYATAPQIENSSDGITANTVISASPEQAPETTAYIQIAEGTQVFAQNGNQIEGDLEVKLVYFDPTSEEALRAFPGGLEVYANIDNNEPEAGVFTSAGLVNITMESGGKSVKTFSESILVDIEINSEIYNPEEGRTIREGDEIPYWSMSTSTNQWELEGTTVVELNSQSGKLYARMEVDHLSYWNLDWFSSANCTQNSRVIINLNNLPEGYYPCGLENTETGLIFRYAWKYLKDGDAITFYNTPQSMNVRLHVFENGVCNRNSMAISEEFAICGEVNKVLNLNATTSTPDVVNFDLKAECIDNPDISARPNTPIYFKSSDCRYWQYLGYMYNGKMTTSQLVIGKTYEFWTVYSDVFTYLVPSSNIEYVYQYAESPCNSN